VRVSPTSSGSSSSSSSQLADCCGDSVATLSTDCCDFLVVRSTLRSRRRFTSTSLVILRIIFVYNISSCVLSRAFSKCYQHATQDNNCSRSFSKLNWRITNERLLWTRSVETESWRPTRKSSEIDRTPFSVTSSTTPWRWLPDWTAAVLSSPLRSRACLLPASSLVVSIPTVSHRSFACFDFLFYDRIPHNGHGHMSTSDGMYIFICISFDFFFFFSLCFILH